MLKQSAPRQTGVPSSRRAALHNTRLVVLIGAMALLTIGIWDWQVVGNLTNTVVTMLIMALSLTVIFWLGARNSIGEFAIEHAALEARLGYRADILDAITASDPRAVVVADRWERILFANREAARRVGRDSESLIGSTLQNALGDAHTRQAKERLQAALKSRAPVIHIDREGSGLLPRIIQTSYVPLTDTEHLKSAVLITETDITAIIAEREQRERMLRQLLDVCVALVDRRDPFASGHSALVGSVSRKLAEHMRLDQPTCDTAEISGLLMNFGKVLVPQDILTKTTALSPSELKLVRDSMMSSADVLSIVQFGLPVVDTLRQVHEHVDGTGQPEGRRGDDIIITARVCALINSFVAMISSRAHRSGMSVVSALEALGQDKAYDPKILRELTVAVAAGKLDVELQRVQRSGQVSIQREKKLAVDALHIAATETAESAQNVPAIAAGNMP